MKMWTSHRFAAILRRVSNSSGRERSSVGVFANPNCDAVISRLPACVDAQTPPKLDAIAAGGALPFPCSRIWPQSQKET